MELRIAALLADPAVRWGATGKARALTWAAADAVPAYYGPGADERVGFAPLTLEQRDGVALALAEVAAVARVTFTLADAAVADIVIGSARMGAEIGSYAYYPSPPAKVGGDVWLNNLYPDFLHPDPGTFAFRTFLHEIGHALGLKHPGNYDAISGGTDGPYLPAEEDNAQYSVMSYAAHPHTTIEPRTPMLHDVAALQYLFGANRSHAAGDDVHVVRREVATIWDAGGHDRLDAGAETSGVALDLGEGRFSSTGGLIDNLAIAFGVAIEDATGGAGDDTLAGNALANRLEGGPGGDLLDGLKGADLTAGGPGDDTHVVEGRRDAVVEAPGEGTDTLYLLKGALALPENVERLELGDLARGGTGNALANTLVGNGLANRLAGGAGEDVFVFAGGWGRDRITDFTAGEDLIDLRPAGLSFADLTIAPGRNSVTVAADGDTIKISGTDALGPGDFLLL
jgi:serralysin